MFYLLGDRAVCFHFKDYRVTGSNVGFSVSGAPFGAGQIDVAHLLTRAFSLTENPQIYLETWTPCTGARETDIATDDDWLRISVKNVRTALQTYEASRSS